MLMGRFVDYEQTYRSKNATIGGLYRSVLLHYVRSGGGTYRAKGRKTRESY